MERSEAIEVLKKYQYDPEVREALECLHPELKESEDERIRKEISKFLKDIHNDSLENRRFIADRYGDAIPDDMIPTWLAWLEKIGDKAFSVERLFAEAGIKPAYKDGNSWCVFIGKNIQEGICGFGETPRDAYVNFLKKLWGKAFEQKLAWSEKDEKMYTATTFALAGFMGNDKLDWLKSLKSRVQPQPKSDWNNKDEISFNRLMATCADERVRKSSVFSEKEIKDLMDWLESIKSRVQPLWKPSDEQMAQLECVARQNKDNMLGKELMTLFNDLKNLKR